MARPEPLRLAPSYSAGPDAAPPARPSTAAPAGRAPRRDAATSGRTLNGGSVPPGDKMRDKMRGAGGTAGRAAPAGVTAAGAALDWIAALRRETGLPEREEEPRAAPLVRSAPAAPARRPTTAGHVRAPGAAARAAAEPPLQPCPLSTGGGTRRVQLVREEGRDVSS